mgnify:CR=1 FL=1
MVPPFHLYLYDSDIAVPTEMIGNISWESELMNNLSIDLMLFKCAKEIIEGLAYLKCKMIY